VASDDQTRMNRGGLRVDCYSASETRRIQLNGSLCFLASFAFLLHSGPLTQSSQDLLSSPLDTTLSSEDKIFPGMDQSAVSASSRQKGERQRVRVHSSWCAPKIMESVIRSMERYRSEVGNENPGAQETGQGHVQVSSPFLM
jgi:hypothetical protein